MGQTATAIPDGRTISIAGEYEDGYDPDFYIYNDVIVTHPDGNIEIFGYSTEAFPPTDFHTATLVDGRIIVIGNLSYPEFRQGKVQVLALDPDTLAFQQVETHGECPPWLHHHTGELANDGRSILIRGGEFIGRRWPASVENLDDWLLDVKEWRWTRLTTCDWPRFAFTRKDGKWNHLFWLRRHAEDRLSAKAKGRVEEMIADLGPAPRLDLLAGLYAPAITGVAPAEEDTWRSRRSKVASVQVRYDEDNWAIILTVEGKLPTETVDLLCHDLREKLALIEGCEIDCAPLWVDAVP